MNANYRERLKDKKRIVIKIGSSSLIHAETGRLDFRKLEILARELSDLHNQGKDVVLVSSGAIAVGAAALGMKGKPAELEKKQACAAVGQARLMTIYQKLFGEYNPDAQFIDIVENMDDNMRKLGKSSTGSNVGTGGMATKLTAAIIATAAGADMVIANGNDFHNIHRIVEGRSCGTLFVGNKKEEFFLIDYIEKLL